MAKQRKANKRHNSHTQDNNNMIDLDQHRAKKVVLIPRNLNQETYISLLQDQNINYILAHGPAGTGKTLLAVMQAIKELKEGTVDKIIITRPIVGADDEKLGFLPGGINEKMDPWMRPIMDVFKEYYSPTVIAKMMEEELIEIAPLAYMRGRNLKHAFIVADEMQNSSPTQFKMLLTRLAEGSRMAITGDLEQGDRADYNNGLLNFLNLESKKESGYIGIIKFGVKDIERHPAVKDVLAIYDN